MIEQMPATIIDGKRLASEEQARIADRAAALRRRGRVPRLDALLVDSGDNAARLYAQNQARTCERLGIDYQLHELPRASGLGAICATLDRLDSEASVHAVMVHLPLPDGVDPYLVQCRIPPAKDVEGVNPANIGNIVYGHSSWAPCTALAAVRLIESTGTELRGKRAVVVGASNHVGKPIAVLLMRADATVISANKFTAGLSDLARSADILVAAAGVPRLITPDMVRPGAIVVDVGVNRVETPDGHKMTVGDVDFEAVRPIAGYLSPVPGGVGPMTVTVLLGNTVEAAER
ncbi:MAG: bifunctional 5,10-methylenetetrahydrofolate dehydrogenase/5,10-methenyltetrahydrofolate cyclohydrolase [Leptolyngbya sp. PLA3]|nr:MAG: bifunctional 5,10-methylenetetrahydrofolate dehydrogenase/5,10-methenyltetrahydrofolate cyclohydrolase [Cyanobacteria bacterium CYA]MCE7968732.1 bifunctional 5,10-methylenetetrahydrofolate dehydrogenase/5,10-methenyltetrahydrofolate cyclohydrolase [Leptolyngbya sp. PL-A3]